MRDFNFSGDDLIGHIGSSVHHPFFRKVLKEIKQEVPFSIERPNGNGLQIDKIWNNDIGLYFDFTTPIGYFHFTNNEVKKIFTNDKYELILSEVNFSNERKFEIHYPFGINIGDDIKTVSTKIGKKPDKKYKSNGSPYHLGYICYYYTEFYRIITYLSEEKKLLSINVQFSQVSDKKYIVDSATIQKKSQISFSKNISKIEKLKNDLPIKKWTKRLAKGDNIFNEKNLKDSENILIGFIEEVSSGLTENSNSKIRKAIKKVVEKFNKLNIRHENFIETMEREELAEFINKIANLTGLTNDTGGAITEEWREW